MTRRPGVRGLRLLDVNTRRRWRGGRRSPPDRAVAYPTSAATHDSRHYRGWQIRPGERSERVLDCRVSAQKPCCGSVLL